MLDQKDLVILSQLKKNAKFSSRSLAKVSGLPISTVHRRIRKLEKEGIIKGYTVLVDYAKLGKPVEVLFFINLEEVIPGKGHIPMSNVRGEIKKLDDVVEISSVEGGNFDLIGKARIDNLSNVTQLMEKLRSIEGIDEVSCVIVAE